jgi:hypothetical protein
LGNTGFSDVGARILWKSLKKSNVKVLQLWNNYLTEFSLVELVQVVESNELELNYLGLNDNDIKDVEMVKEINELLKN